MMFWNKPNPVFATICAFMFFQQLCAQVQTPRYITTTAMSNGFYEYLPQGYETNSNKYPLLISAHGAGEFGDGSPSQLVRVLRSGVPRSIDRDSFPSFFISNSDSFRFLVISPQFTNVPTSPDLNNIIDYCIQHYRVDINRIYLTGLSAGGGTIWDYAAYSTSYGNRIAAMVPVCGFSYPTEDRAQTIASSNLPIWATHNDSDRTVPSQYTISWVQYINAAPTPPAPLAKKTIFVSFSHNAWSRTYDTSFREDNLNVFEWMLQFKRNNITLPVADLTFNARKTVDGKVLLHWSTASELQNRGFEIQRSGNGVNFSSVGFVNGQGTTNSYTSYQFTDPQPFAAKNYYRLKQVDADNRAQLSVVRFIDYSANNKITIYPNPVADILNMNISSASTGSQLLIKDVNGRLLSRSYLKGAGTHSISVRNLPPAIYSVEIVDETSIFKSSVIKQ